MTKQYELMVLLPTSMTQDTINGFSKTVRALVEGKGGKIVDEQSLGRRTMAYEIKKQREAYYMLYRLELDTQAVLAVEREVRLSDDVIRSLLTIAEEKAA